MRYQVYRPPNPAAPVVAWLHGRGEAGDNNHDQLVWLDLVMGTSRHEQEFPAWIVAVQVPRECSRWSQPDHDGIDGLDRLHAALRDLRRRHSQIPAQSLLVGISQGGSGCWAAMERWPQRFSAALVLGASELPRSPPHHPSMQHVWAFQSSADGRAAWHNLVNYAQTINANGGSIRTTHVVSATHDCWTAAFGEYKAMDWLLHQVHPNDRHLSRYALLATSFSMALVLLLAFRWRRSKTAQTRRLQ